MAIDPARFLHPFQLAMQTHPVQIVVFNDVPPCISAQSGPVSGVIQKIAYRICQPGHIKKNPSDDRFRIASHNGASAAHGL